LIYQIDIWKVATSIVAAGLIAAFGWIIKVETEMVQMRYELGELRRSDSDIRKDLDKSESKYADLDKRQRDSEIDSAELKSTLKAILSRVNEIKEDISRLR